MVHARPDFACLDDSLARRQAQRQLGVVCNCQRLEHPRLVDRSHPTGEVERARHVLRPLSHHQPPDLRAPGAQPRRLRIHGLEPEPLEEDVRRRVVREREHQQRAVSERHPPVEPVRQ